MATASVRNCDECRVCGRSTSGRYPLCFCCGTIARQLRIPLVPVVAMVDYRIGDRMHRLLRGYKDAPTSTAREARTAALAALVELWLAANGASLATRMPGGWDLVATVPSSGRRGGSPGDALVGRVPLLAERHRSLLVRGADDLGHLEAARHGYEVPPDLACFGVRGRRALVFDDSVTTGARAQSAALALRRAGARVVGILAVGRAVAAGIPHAPAGAAAAAELG